MNATLTARQRTAPPMNRWAARRGVDSGGYDQVSPRTLAPGLDTELARYPATTNDALIVRDRSPYYDHDRYMPPAESWVNWTEAGPVRPELHMRQATWRPEVGASRSRYPVIDSPTTGMHTMTTNGVARTVQRFVATPQMIPGRQDRLSPSQYAGQTYSQTTQLQGGRRK